MIYLPGDEYKQQIQVGARYLLVYRREASVEFVKIEFHV